MAEKDITEKTLMDYNDVFADIINGFIFKGENRVCQDSLENTSVHAQFKADDSVIHEEERDVVKIWKEYGVKIAVCGLENQSQPYKFMPARVIAYDGASYKSQILDKEPAHLTPVITLVLYFGMDHWKGPKNLKELFDEYPEELDPYLNDYRIHVFEVAWLSDAEINKFTSDFRIVANFFAQMRRTKGNYIPDSQEIEHVDALLKLLSVMTGEKGYVNITATFTQKEKVSMKDIIVPNFLSKAKEEAIAEGRAEGRTETRMVLSWLKNNGRDTDVDAFILSDDEDFRNQILEEYKEANNDCEEG